MGVDLFQPIAKTSPHPRFSRKDHPQPPKSWKESEIKHDEESSKPISTNKFYANLFLGNQDQPVFMYPYTIWWNRGAGEHWGVGISHTSKEQRVFGPDSNSITSQFMFHPLGIRSISFSAREFDNTMKVELSESTQFSITADFMPGAGHGTGRVLHMPIVIGTGFITGIYYNLAPQFSSVVGYRSIERMNGPRSDIQKYHIQLNDNSTWLLYATVPSSENFSLRQQDGFTLVNDSRVRNVIVQIAKMPPNSEGVYDAHAGKFAVKATLSGSADGRKGSVRINWSTKQANKAGQVLVFALTHQVAMFDGNLRKRYQGFTLDSQSKGAMYAYSTNDFVMNDMLPVDIGFLPWSRLPGAEQVHKFGFSRDTISIIGNSCVKEMQEDINAQTDLNSMYFSGKALDKFAYLCYVAFEILQDHELTKYGLERLKAAFRHFSSNHQQNPLVYDKTYKGIISSGALNTGNVLEDFGNSYYNDHHFHYGYFIHAAAIIGYIDKGLGGNWIYDNKDYVNMLVRDVANPSDQDPYFPVSRSFDWFHGHSWAKGLFESGDGKDQESTSEDYHHAYGIKLWGKVSGDSSMEARGNMMLALMNRSFNSYFLLADNNAIQDPRLIGNRVTGILFENKIDHTTYFSPDIQCIQGIHMIPVTPVSSYIRSPEFCYQEWASLLQHIVDKVNDGWKGILYANVALFDPHTSYQFFADPKFSNAWLDGGASRTWYLAYAAGVGGALPK
ncbi:endo-1,3(4)-beta-glucanase [Dipodascopsis uninucleata]